MSQHGLQMFFLLVLAPRSLPRPALSLNIQSSFRRNKWGLWPGRIGLQTDKTGHQTQETLGQVKCESASQGRILFKKPHFYDPILTTRVVASFISNLLRQIKFIQTVSWKLYILFNFLVIMSKNNIEQNLKPCNRIWLMGRSRWLRKSQIEKWLRVD